MYDTQTPYIACFTIFRRGREVAFVLRQNTSWMNGFYGLPAGKVEKDETFTDGTIREAKEEAGVDVEPKNLKYVHTVHRKSDDNSLFWVDVYFEATEWEGELINAEPDIHAELKWLDLDHLPDNIIPAVRHVLEAIDRGEVYSEYGWNQ